MLRTVVAGGPRVGKTTLSETLATQVGTVARHSDDLIGTVSFADAADAIVEWMALPGPWVIEGVTAVRALRRWLDTNDEGVPCERVFWSTTPKVERTSGQERMAKGIETVWAQIEERLTSRGVCVQRF